MHGERNIGVWRLIQAQNWLFGFRPQLYALSPRRLGYLSYLGVQVPLPGSVEVVPAVALGHATVQLHVLGGGAVAAQHGGQITGVEPAPKPRSPVAGRVQVAQQ